MTTYVSCRDVTNWHHSRSCGVGWDHSYILVVVSTDEVDIFVKISK